MNTCDAIQQRLAEAGLEGIQGDAEALNHLESCDDCTEVLASLSELDLAFSQLPQHDAPDALVEASLAAGRRTPAAPPLRAASMALAFMICGSCRPARV